MTSFTGCGDEDYQKFSEAVNGLLLAFEANDPEAFSKAVKVVTERMESCHSIRKN